MSKDIETAAAAIASTVAQMRELVGDDQAITDALLQAGIERDVAQHGAPATVERILALGLGLASDELERLPAAQRPNFDTWPRLLIAAAMRIMVQRGALRRDVARDILAFAIEAYEAEHGPGSADIALRAVVAQLHRAPTEVRH